MTSLLTSSTGGAATAAGGGCGFEAAPVNTGHVNDLTSVQEAAQQIAYISQYFNRQAYIKYQKTTPNKDEAHYTTFHTCAVLP